MRYPPPYTMKHGLLAAAVVACVLTAEHPAWAQPAHPGTPEPDGGQGSPQGVVATPNGIYAIVPMRGEGRLRVR